MYRCIAKIISAAAFPDADDDEKDDDDNGEGGGQEVRGAESDNIFGNEEQLGSFGRLSDSMRRRLRRCDIAYI